MGRLGGRQHPEESIKDDTTHQIGVLCKITIFDKVQAHIVRDQNVSVQRFICCKYAVLKSKVWHLIQY